MNTTNVTLNQTKEFVRALFNGKKDKIGDDYYNHCLRVLQYLEEGDLYNITDDMRHAALLHDVLEDTYITEENLINFGYEYSVYRFVDLLTRKEGVKYIDYIKDIRSTNDCSLIQIKLADLRDNLDGERLNKIDDVKMRDSLRHRYLKAYDILIGYKYET